MIAQVSEGSWHHEGVTARSIIVVGGGVFGLTASVELARRQWDVVLLEAGKVPRAEASTTDVCKLVRVEYGDDVVYTELAEQSIVGWRAWNEVWDRPLYHETGVLFLTPAEMAPGSYELTSYDFLTGRGRSLERLDAAAIRKRYPVWQVSDLADGFFDPDGGWTESAEVASRLFAEATRVGVEVREETRVLGLDEGDGRIRGVRIAEGVLSADFVLVAAGAWTSVLLPHLEDVMWPSGHPVLFFAPQEPAHFAADVFPPWGSNVAKRGWYGFCAMADGQVKIAHHGDGVRVHPDEPRRVHPRWQSHFRDFLAQELPELAEAPIVGERLCLYSDTFDGHFWIDHDQERPGLVVAAGGSGHGLKFAPILGGLIADVVEGRRTDITSRFQARGLRKRTLGDAARSLSHGPHSVELRAMDSED